MRIAHFDPFSGASGDMTLGALLDAGGSLPRLSTEIGRLGLGRVVIHADRVVRNGLSGTQVRIEAPESQPHRRWSEVRAIIERSSIASRPKARALRIFLALAEAEASVHGTDVDSVHFHEVGAIDAIIDIVGSALLFDQLAIDTVSSAPLRTGSGVVAAAHGLMPIPAPATAALIARAQVPVAAPLPGSDGISAELLTPTGAAILTTLAEFRQPAFTPEAVGYGFGQKELPWPNALRVTIGVGLEQAVNASEIEMETNLDDMSPQHVELLVERLFAAGALDVWLTPIMMKKGRPATMVSLLAPADRRTDLESTLIENTTTLGVRVRPIERTKAARRIETVETRWGPVRLKLRGWHGRVIDVNPEYDDCAAIARGTGATLRDVWNEAHRLGEVYVGRKLSATGDLMVLER